MRPFRGNVNLMKNNIFASNLEKNDQNKLKIGMLLCHYLFNLDAKGILKISISWKFIAEKVENWPKFPVFGTYF